MSFPKIEIQKYIAAKNSSIPSAILDPFLALNPDHAVRAILSRGIRDGTLKADNILLHYLNRLETDEDLFAMSIALRNGANPNLYVVIQGDTNMHILAYLYKNWNNKFRNTATKNDRLRLTMLCLLVMGSDPTLPAIDVRAGSVPSLPMARPVLENVLQWLNTGGGQGFDPDHDLNQAYPDIRKGTDLPTVKRVAILTGKLDLLQNQKLTEKDFKLALLAVTEAQIYPLLPHPVAMTNLDFKYVYEALLAYNTELLEYYVMGGILFSYPLFNNIILKARQFKIEGSMLFYTMFARLIQLSIGRGQSIDDEQLNLLLILEKPDYDIMMANYNKPYWQKVCASSNLYNDKITKRLRDIAHHTGLESSDDHGYICEQLFHLSEISTDKLIAAAKQRQKIRIAGEHATLPELIDSTEIPILTCYNANQVEGDAYDYTELSISHYRDSQGNMWCFTSDKYNILSESRVNPATGLKLPDKFVELINYKIRRYKELGFDMKHPYRFSTIIEETMKTDVVNDSESLLQYTLMIDYLSDFDVGKNHLEKLTKEEMDGVLKSIGFNANLTLLETHTHVLYTLAYIINGFIILDPDRAKLIASKLHDLTHRKTTTIVRPNYFPTQPPPPQPPQIVESPSPWPYSIPSTSNRFGVPIPYSQDPPLHSNQYQSPLHPIRSIQHQ